METFPGNDEVLDTTCIREIFQSCNQSDLEMESVSLIKLSSLAENIHAKTGELSESIDLDIEEL